MTCDCSCHDIFATRKAGTCINCGCIRDGTGR